MFDSVRNMFKSRKDRADEAVQKARQKSDQVEEHLRNEIHAAEVDIALLQSRLAQCLQTMAPKAEVMNITKRIKQNQKKKRQAEGKLANVHKESQQLTDATLNLEVIQTMNESLEAQKMLQQAVCDKDIDDLDELIDDIEEKREETSELGERLGSLGIDDDDIYDDTTMDEKDVMDALGYAVQKEDQKYFAQVKRQIEITHDIQKSYLDQQTAPETPIDEGSFPQVPKVKPRNTTLQENRTGWNW